MQLKKYKIAIQEYFLKKSFLRNVVTLASGTAGAQLILLLAAPLLSRMYSPESFGLLAVFMAIVSSVLPAASGRYEVASMLPKSDKIGLDIFVVGIWLSLLFFILFFLVIFLFDNQITLWVNEPRVKDWLIYIPITFLALGWYTSFTYIANRAMHYKHISVSKFIQAITMVLLSILMSLLGYKFIGLLIASIISPICALIYLLFAERDIVSKIHLKWTLRNSILAKKYKSYLFYNALPSILTGITVSLPVLYISKYYTIEELGYYALVMRVLYAPINFISVSVGQVNIKRVIDLIHAKQNISSHIYKSAFILLIISLVPVIIFGFWGPELFSFIFGEEWYNAGSMAQILVLALSVRFVSTSLSTSIGGTNNNHLAAIWRVMALILTLSVLFIIGPFETINIALIAIVVNDLTLYILYFWFIIKAVKKPRT